VADVIAGAKKNKLKSAESQSALKKYMKNSHNPNKNKNKTAHRRFLKKHRNKK